jgi:(5-formylfuran-3-yl)methyl phosphate synthase
MKLLVSVRTIDEALAAAEHGADLIDLKEPQAGALGALPLADIRAIVRVLRVRHPRLRLSATVGDLHADHDGLLQRVIDTAACGIDDVKVGLTPEDAVLLTKLGALAEAGLPHRAQIVPVLLADRGVPIELVDGCLGLPFAAVMLDTQHKAEGSLVALRPASELSRFVKAVQAHSQWAGIAGSLRREDLPSLFATGCDFAGFRGAVCTHDRRGALEASLVAALRRARDGAAAHAVPG